MLKTLKQQGGLTLNHNLNMINFSQGYQVSFEDVDVININTIDNNGLIERLHVLKQSMADTDYIGLWIDSERLYIDYSRKIDDLEIAFATGKALNQLAIFDWSTMNSIYLNNKEVI